MNRGRAISTIVLVVACSMLAVVVACVPAENAATHPFSALVVFGDSLSDNGNIAGELNIVPPPPYAPGRFSNGDIWIDHVARHFGLPAEPAYCGGTNFAHGGSGTGRGTADIRGAAVGFNLREQVNWYLDLYQPQGDELFIIWSGGNDLFDILGGGTNITTSDAAANVAIAVTVLYDAGARRFFVISAPDLSVTPRYRNSSRRMLARQLTDDYNAALLQHMDELASLRDIHMTTLDAAPIVRDFVEHPPALITNTTDPAWTGGLLGYFGEGEVVANPDAYLYWDQQHPTRMGHALIADVVISAIEQSIAADPTETTSTLAPQSDFAGSFSFWYRYLGISGV